MFTHSVLKEHSFNGLFPSISETIIIISNFTNTRKKKKFGKKAKGQGKGKHWIGERSRKEQTKLCCLRSLGKGKRQRENIKTKQRRKGRKVPIIFENIIEFGLDVTNTFMSVSMLKKKR